jgi:hypothetical protein
MEEKMDLKKRMREVKFITEHTLSDDQLKQIIKDKLERAERFKSSKQVQEERTLQR